MAQQPARLKTMDMRMRVRAVRVALFQKAVAVLGVVMVVGVAVAAHAPGAQAAACHVQEPQQNQHHADGRFQTGGELTGDQGLQQNNENTDEKYDGGMTQAPESAQEPSRARALVSRDESGDGDHVVGVGGVAYAQPECEGQPGPAQRLLDDEELAAQMGGVKLAKGLEQAG